uniref:Uncharacterized protein n=1 Tax=Lepeophtheirus salmonis TaxID=72036 RepID=A0A0K2T1E2_LEPSM
MIISTKIVATSYISTHLILFLILTILLVDLGITYFLMYLEYDNLDAEAERPGA